MGCIGSDLIVKKISIKDNVIKEHIKRAQQLENRCALLAWVDRSKCDYRA